MQNLDLQEIRKKLDAIDKDLVALFEERMKLCADVASFKIETGKPVYDGEREKQKLRPFSQCIRIHLRREKSVRRNNPIKIRLPPQRVRRLIPESLSAAKKPAVIASPRQTLQIPFKNSTFPKPTRIRFVP